MEVLFLNHKQRSFAIIFFVLTIMLSAFTTNADATHSPPSDISPSQFSQDCARLDVDWSDQASATNYSVRRYQDGNLYGIVYTNSSSAFIDKNLKANVEYSYAIASYAGHWSAYSATGSSKKTDCSGSHFSKQKTTALGWLGISGTITTANPILRGGSCNDHSDAGISLARPVNNDTYWIQTGWSKGVDVPNCVFGNISTFVEIWQPAEKRIAFMGSILAGSEHKYQIYQTKQIGPYELIKSPKFCKFAP